MRFIRRLVKGYDDVTALYEFDYVYLGMPDSGALDKMLLPYVQTGTPAAKLRTVVGRLSNLHLTTYHFWC